MNSTKLRFYFGVGALASGLIAIYNWFAYEPILIFLLFAVAFSFTFEGGKRFFFKRRPGPNIGKFIELVGFILGWWVVFYCTYQLASAYATGHMQLLTRFTPSKDITPSSDTVGFVMSLFFYTVGMLVGAPLMFSETRRALTSRSRPTR